MVVERQSGSLHKQVEIRFMLTQQWRRRRPRELWVKCADQEKGFFYGSSAVVCDGITHLGTLEALACRETFDITADLLLGPI
jgi:hypothetical protein